MPQGFVLVINIPTFKISARDFNLKASIISRRILRRRATEKTG